MGERQLCIYRSERHTPPLLVETSKLQGGETPAHLPSQTEDNKKQARPRGHEQACSCSPPNLFTMCICAAIQVTREMAGKKNHHRHRASDSAHGQQAKSARHVWPQAKNSPASRYAASKTCAAAVDLLRTSSGWRALL